MIIQGHDSTRDKNKWLVRESKLALDSFTSNLS